MSLVRLGKLLGRFDLGLRTPVRRSTFAWFRRVFLGKFLLLDLLGVVGGGDEQPTLAMLRLGVLGAGIALSETRRWARTGPFLILIIRLLGIASSFPYTINHAFFDAALLLLLALGEPDGDGGLHPLRVAQVGILTVFFYAGVQKLVHGYYVDGQLFTLRVLYDEGDMGRRLRWMLSMTAKLLDLPLPSPHARPRPSLLVDVEVLLPAWVRGTLCVVSNATWIAEMGLPIAALFRSSRTFAIAGLLGLEALILIVSGEISFGITVVGCLASFFPLTDRLSSVGPTKIE